jgi:hypothetical protein
MEIKLRGLNMDAYYVGPKLNLENNKSYNLLATVLKSSKDEFLLRVFSTY